MDKKEIEELKVSIHDRLRQAIKEENKEKALKLLDETIETRTSYLASFLTMIDILYTLGAEKVGEEFVHEANQLFAERRLFKSHNWAFGPISAEDKVRKRANAWTTRHCVNIDDILEDDEKFTLKVKCPSGGVIRGMQPHGETKKAYPWSASEKGVSYYCTHCLIPFEMMAIERYGYPAWVCLPQPGGRCMQYIFKDPTKVPEKYYKRVGLEKKKAK